MKLNQNDRESLTDKVNTGVMSAAEANAEDFLKNDSCYRALHVCFDMK